MKQVEKIIKVEHGAENNMSPKYGQSVFTQW